MPGTRRRLALATASIVAGLALGYTAARPAIADFFSEKAAIEAQHERLKLESSRAPKGDPTLARPAQEPVVWPTGIFEESQAPFPSAAIRVKNQWQGIVGGAYVQVFAGALGQDPQQGVVLVRIVSKDLEVLSADSYTTPARAGAVRLVSERGLRLELQGEMGQSWRFDLLTRAFLPQ